MTPRSTLPPSGLAGWGLAWGLAGVLTPLDAPVAMVALVLGLTWCAGVGLDHRTPRHHRTITTS